ncbi:hypothetical protein [Plantactinospora soyae]|uniref:Uncharacterized protein n=1 Tax=Plantactinospora soyae TaxID=1544732 RepID=A0A927M5T3_9ACTN|nr:hypothetical protein [Plantactinospora soyae]MBE1487301.1 hypothetical protein [Plantactinospora soyae]
MTGRDDERFASGHEPGGRAGQRRERRYQRLLLLYPRWYREERGAEMLATLTQAAESGSAPPARREIGALVLGALRTRVGANMTGSPGQLWLSALRVAVLLLVAYATASSVPPAGGGLAGLLANWDLFELGAVTVGAFAVAALAQGRYRLGLVLAVAMVVLERWQGLWIGFGFLLRSDGVWLVLVATLLTLPLLRRPPAVGRQPLAWLLAIPLTLVFLPTAFSASTYLHPIYLVAVGVGLLLWSVVDVRALIGSAAILLATALSLVSHSLSQEPGGRTWTPLWLGYLGVTAVLVGIGAVRIRQQARL